MTFQEVLMCVGAGYVVALLTMVVRVTIKHWKSVAAQRRNKMEVGP